MRLRKFTSCRYTPSLCATGTLLIALVVFLCGGKFNGRFVSTVRAAGSGETIVLVRHGEKPIDGLGQLTCMGLNRALKLPAVLIGRFGPAAAIFAPDPAGQVQEGPSNLSYSYVRPLATIEPTAIQLGLPVNTQLLFSDIAGLQNAVTAPTLANSTVFIAWEHKYAYMFAQQMLSHFGQDPTVVPVWNNGDFEMMYVFHITQNSSDNPRPQTLQFGVQQEGLTASLSNSCPGD
jgi:hypothetical protein